MKHADQAVWIRIAWGDNFSKPNHLKPTYVVHYLQTPYVFVTWLNSKHKDLLSQVICLLGLHLPGYCPLHIFLKYLMYFSGLGFIHKISRYQGCKSKRTESQRHERCADVSVSAGRSFWASNVGWEVNYCSVMQIHCVYASIYRCGRWQNTLALIHQPYVIQETVRTAIFIQGSPFINLPFLDKTAIYQPLIATS